MSVTVHPQRCHAVPLGKGGMFLSSLGGVPEKPPGGDPKTPRFTPWARGWGGASGLRAAWELGPENPYNMYTRVRIP